MIEQAARFGASPAVLARLEAEAGRGGDAFEIWRKNGKTLRLFLALGTQWRRAGQLGRRIGLDYAVIPAVAALEGIAVTPARWLDLRRMESAALDALGERYAEEDSRQPVRRRGAR